MKTGSAGDEAAREGQAAAVVGAAAAEGQTPRGEGLQKVRESAALQLYSAARFLAPAETRALRRTAERVFQRLPPPLLCFTGEADMRETLAAAHAAHQSDAARGAARVPPPALSRQDFLPGSACLSADDTAALYGLPHEVTAGEATTGKATAGTTGGVAAAVPALLDKPPRTVEAKVGEVALLDQISARVEQACGADGLRG